MLKSIKKPHRKIIRQDLFGRDEMKAMRSKCTELDEYSRGLRDMLFVVTLQREHICKIPRKYLIQILRQALRDKLLLTCLLAGLPVRYSRKYGKYVPK